jgi:hypothetical protein
MGEVMIRYDGITQEREKVRPPYPKLREPEFELLLEESFSELTGYEAAIRREGAA